LADLTLTWPDFGFGDNIKLTAKKQGGIAKQGKQKDEAPWNWEMASRHPLDPKLFVRVFLGFVWGGLYLLTVHQCVMRVTVPEFEGGARSASVPPFAGM